MKFWWKSLKALWRVLVPKVPRGHELRSRVRRLGERRIGPYMTKQEMAERRKRLARHDF